MRWSERLGGAGEGSTRQDPEDMFAKQDFRVTPGADGKRPLPGIIRYNDVVGNLFDQKA